MRHLTTQNPFTLATCRAVKSSQFPIKIDTRIFFCSTLPMRDSCLKHATSTADASTDHILTHSHTPDSHGAAPAVICDPRFVTAEACGSLNLGTAVVIRDSRRGARARAWPKELCVLRVRAVHTLGPLRNRLCCLQSHLAGRYGVARRQHRQNRVKMESTGRKQGLPALHEGLYMLQVVGGHRTVKTVRGSREHEAEESKMLQKMIAYEAGLREMATMAHMLAFETEMQRHVLRHEQSLQTSRTQRRAPVERLRVQTMALPAHEVWQQHTSTKAKEDADRAMELKNAQVMSEVYKQARRDQAVSELRAAKDNTKEVRRGEKNKKSLKVMQEEAGRFAQVGHDQMDEGKILLCCYADVCWPLGPV
jgi:hypothetical protein